MHGYIYIGREGVAVDLQCLRASGFGCQESPMVYREEFEILDIFAIV